MHALCITGPLGAGKTTTIFRLRPPKGTQLVINEIGELTIDVDRLTGQFGEEVDVSSLVAGCLGCDNAAGFDAIVAKSVQNGYELLLVEPTGVADAREIKAITDRYGLPWSCLALVNPVTFRRNVAEGLLAAQLSVATAVGITRPDQLVDGLEAEVLAYIAHHAPGAPIFYIQPEGTLAFGVDELLLSVTGSGKGHSHVHDEHCNHGHGSHGHTSVAYRLRTNVTLERLLAAMTPARDSIVRVKGVIDGHWFDIVGPEVTVGNPANGEPHAVVIATGPVNPWLFAGIQAERPILPAKKSLMTQEGRDLAEVISAIEYHAGSYPSPEGSDGLPLPGADNDIAVYLSRTPGVPLKYQQMALQARMDYALRAAEVLMRAKAAGRYMAAPDRYASDCLEIGAALAWNARNKPHLLSNELTQAIVACKPAHIAVRGLGSLSSLNLHLLPDNYQGPTSPSAIVSIAQFGMEYEGLPLATVIAAMQHALELSFGYPVWERRWSEALDELTV